MPVQVVRASGEFAYHDGTNLDQVAEELGLTIFEAQSTYYPYGPVRVLMKYVPGQNQRASATAQPPGSPQWIGYFPGGITLDGVTQYIVWTDDDAGRPAGYLVVGGTDSPDATPPPTEEPTPAGDGEPAT